MSLRSPSFSLFSALLAPRTPVVLPLPEALSVLAERVDSILERDSGSPAISVRAALLSGKDAPSLGVAFAAGYTRALGALVPGVLGRRVALAVTEERGNSPRAIETRLSDGALFGKKTFVTLGTFAEHLLVAATTGTDANGRPRIVVVSIPADRPGITFSPLPEMPFVPEIPHAIVTFDRVPVSETDLLPGDGYADCVKPFRTVEDIHVLGAALGHAIGIGRISGAPQAWMEQALSCAAALVGLGDGTSADPGTHLALAGALTAVRACLEQAPSCWPDLAPREQAIWTRDVRLLSVAGSARQKRRETAWSALDFRRSP